MAIYIFCTQFRMNLLYAILVFFIVGLVYSHLVQEFAPSVPLKLPVEVYELDYQDPQQFQEVCRVQQPVVILDPPAYPSNIPTLQECIRQYPKQSLCIKNRLDFPHDTTGIEVPLHTAVHDLFTGTDTSSHYFTENNGADPQSFLCKTGLDRMIAEEADHALAPPMTMYKNYDWMTGGSGVTTPLRYHTYTRKYLRVIEGPSIRVKMVPRSVSNSHTFHERSDYDTYTFLSEMDLWNSDTKDVVEVELHCGHMLYVPPYWWYSIQYQTGPCPRQASLAPDTVTQDYCLEQKKPDSLGLPSVVVEHTYATYMNRLASIGDLARHWLQRQTTMQIVLRTFQGAISPVKDDHHEDDVSALVSIPLQESIEIL
jgi:hypothetical protein